MYVFLADVDDGFMGDTKTLLEKEVQEVKIYSTSSSEDTLEKLKKTKSGIVIFDPKILDEISLEDFLSQIKNISEDISTILVSDEED